MELFKLQWLQYPRQISGCNMNNVRCEASRYFRNKTRQNVKYVINELATCSKKSKVRKLYRAIIKIMNDYHSRRN
jgi:hypothetical protein